MSGNRRAREPVPGCLFPGRFDLIVAAGDDEPVYRRATRPSPGNLYNRGMCGRYALTIAVPELAAALDARGDVSFGPHYNIAPTVAVPVLHRGGDGRLLSLMRWGLVPSWSKGPDGRYAMHNARIEGIAGKPAYRGPVRRQRCLIPASGWYEWQKVDGRKQPWFIARDDGAPLLFAGLWERWNGGDAPLWSCTIITGDASPALAHIHHRMPLTVRDGHEARWRDPAQSDADQAIDSLRCDGDIPDLAARPVSSHVNNARNDDPHCLEPLTDR